MVIKWLWMIVTDWLWTVIELSMVMDGCLVFPMVGMSSCAGSQEKIGFYIGCILCFCNVYTFNHHDLFLTVQDEWTTMRVENTITMHNWLPTKFTFQCRLNFNSSTGVSLASHTPQSQGERGSGDHAYRELF